MTAYYDPREAATEQSRKLSARSRHVCLLLGAGTSAACGLPLLATLQQQVLAELSPEQRTLFQPISSERTLEEALSRVRSIRALLDGTSGEFDGLSYESADALDRAICSAIIRRIDLPKIGHQPYVDLARWTREPYHLPIEIFTVNYDLLLERGFEEIGVHYFDGFVGNLRARFREDLVDDIDPTRGDMLPATCVRLWKLHGSINWEFDVAAEGLRRIVRLGAAATGNAAAIYPSEEKYDDSRRVPFVVLFDRLRRALAAPETVLIVAGYSFGDMHVNDVIFESALRHPRSEFYITCHADVPAIVQSKASQLKNIVVHSRARAIVGGVTYEWQGDELPGVFENGDFLLGDFTKLAGFLAKVSVANDDESR